MCSNSRVRTSEITDAASLASHCSYQTAMIEVKIPATASTEDVDQRVEILLAERVVDQEFQAERHDDIEQRLDQDAEADEYQYLAVVLQIRLDEPVDGRERAGGFLGGKDDEVLVILIVLRFELVVIIIFFVVIAVVHGCLGATIRCSVGVRRKLGVELQIRIVRGSGYLGIRRCRLGRHETNRCYTAGTTALSRAVAGRATAPILYAIAAVAAK